MDIAIVAVGYNRPQTLFRLLHSLNNADYSSLANISLVISIDYSGSEDCFNVAKGFQWPFGEKEVIFHEKRLGLKKHIIKCGDLTNRFDGIILLEDDIVVSPSFYSYAVQAAKFYLEDSKVAGISLYSYRLNECAKVGFEAVDDGFDNYFMQVPSSWGQLWTRNQWEGFKLFMEDEDRFGKNEFAALPAFVQHWPNDSSWKKFFYLYVIVKNKYFVFPKVSLSTNYGDIGQHNEQESNTLQVPLLLRNRIFQFSSLSESLSIYDHYFEIESNCIIQFLDKDNGYGGDFEVDLNGAKPLSKIKSKHLISIKQSNKPLKKIPVNLFPAELNLFFLSPHTNNPLLYTFALTESFVEGGEEDRLLKIQKRRILPLVLSDIKQEIFKMKEYQLGKKIIRPLQNFRSFIGTRIFRSR